MADVIDQFILIFQSFANPALTTLYKFYPKTAFRIITYSKKNHYDYHLLHETSRHSKRESITETKKSLSKQLENI